jgi:hypothetical protein
MNTRRRPIALSMLLASFAGCLPIASPTSGPDDNQPALEESDLQQLAWVAPDTAVEVEVNDVFEMSVATDNPAARAVRFTIDGAEVAVCDPSADPDEDCHIENRWRWSTTIANAGHHTLGASFVNAAGATVSTTRDIDVLPAGMANSEIDPSGSDTEADPLADSQLVDEGTSTVVQDIGSRGYLDPSRGSHNVFGGRHWSVQGQRVLLASGRLDGSVSAVAACWNRYGTYIQRYADNRYISRASVVATLITESNCTNPAGSSDGLSSGPMQVTASTCSAITGLSRTECRRRMHDLPSFSIDVGIRYMASSYQRRQHHNDPPKIAAAYNAGSIRSTRTNAWHMVSTGNHIDRFVAAYNAYRTWERRTLGR